LADGRFTFYNRSSEKRRLRDAVPVCLQALAPQNQPVEQVSRAAAGFAMLLAQSSPEWGSRDIS
jgi:hypothetical protein